MIWRPYTCLDIVMPDCGEAGVIIMTDRFGRKAEFRGRPYSQWDLGEDTPMYRLHCEFIQTDVSRLHSGFTQTTTKWMVEWEVLAKMFDEAIDFVA